MQRFFALAFSLLLLLTGSGCSDDEPVRKVNLDRRVETTAPAVPEGLTYAYLPQYSHAVSYSRHRKLVEYLSREIGRPVRQVFPATFDEHVNMVARGEIDISFSNPVIYTRLARLGAQAFARMVELSGRPFFRGQIISRRDNRAVRSIEDCRGKRWIAVDPSSAGGFLFPLGLFREHGIRRANFAEVAFAPGPGGNQEKVVMAVFAGAYDIGSIREGTLDLLKDRIQLDRIRVLAVTQPFPGWVYAARKGLNSGTVERVARALTRLDPNVGENREILAAAGMHSIIAARDRDYDPIRAMMAALESEDFGVTVTPVTPMIPVKPAMTGGAP